MRFDPFLNLHDVHLHFAFRRVCDHYDATILFGDGGTVTEWDILEDSPNLNGYRPDGVAGFEEGIILIEVKSQGDFLSSHSRKQYLLINRLLTEKEKLHLYIYIFDSHGANAIPSEFSSSVFHKIKMEQV